MSTLSKDLHAIGGSAKLWAGGDKRALNSRKLPNNVNAPTDFSYLTTNGSLNGSAYLGGTDYGEPANGLTYGGVQVTYGGVDVTYGA